MNNLTLKELEQLAQGTIKNLGDRELYDSLIHHTDALLLILQTSVEVLQDCCDQYRERVKIMADGIKETHDNDNG